MTVIEFPRRRHRPNLSAAIDLLQDEVAGAGSAKERRKLARIVEQLLKIEEMK